MGSSIEKNGLSTTIIRRTLSKKQHEILRYLSDKGPSDCYKIKKECNMYYPSTYKSLIRLEKQGFVWRNPKEISEKGTPKTPFRLTMRGLAEASNTEDFWKNLDKIVKVWIDLAPLVFGNWEYFKERDLDEEAKMRLRQMFQGEGIRKFHDRRSELFNFKDQPYYLYTNVIWTWLLHPLEDRPRDNSNIGSIPAMLFTEFFFLPMLDPFFRFNHREWLKALKNNIELREWAKLIFKARTSEYQSEVDRYDRLLQEMKNPIK